MERRYFENTKEQQERTAHLQNELRQIEKNIHTLERKYYVTEEISGAIFDKFHSELLNERQEILKKLDEQKTLSNPLEAFQKTLEVCAKLLEIWGCGEFEVRERLQKILFPEGIYFDKEKDAYRTPYLNSVFA